MENVEIFFELEAFTSNKIPFSDEKLSATLYLSDNPDIYFQ